MFMLRCFARQAFILQNEHPGFVLFLYLNRLAAETCIASARKKHLEKFGSHNDEFVRIVDLRGR